jgi:hypothetical protein
MLPVIALLAAIWAKLATRRVSRRASMTRTAAPSRNIATTRSGVAVVVCLLLLCVDAASREDGVGLVASRIGFEDPSLLTWTKIPLDDRSRASKALQNVMEAKGLAGMRELSGDADLMVALHARWECVKGKPAEVGKFVEFFKRNLRVEPPRWWSDLLAGVQVGAQAHAVPGVASGQLAANSRLVAGRLEIRASPEHAGFWFKLRAIDPKENRLAWSAEVWAAGRTMLAGVGVHQIEMLVSEGRLFVFGAESHGIYAECFRLMDGKPLVRFCSCYWFNFSERWHLR